MIALNIAKLLVFIFNLIKGLELLIEILIKSMVFILIKRSPTEGRRHLYGELYRDFPQRLCTCVILRMQKTLF